MKILCVMITHFPWLCEMLRQPELNGRQVVITHASGSQKLVLDYSPDLDGLSHDMPLQQALSRHGQVELLPADTPFYRSVFNELLDALEEVSPLVEGAELGCSYLGVDGLQLIYPDDEAIVNAVREVIPQTFSPQIGIAGNKFLSYLAARQSPTGGHMVLEEEAAGFLAKFPCDVLPISGKSKEKLSRFGLRTLGQVAVIPSGPLLSQFGSEGKRIRELALGCDDTPLIPRMLAEVIEEDIMLSSVSVSLEVVLVVTTSLLARVFKCIAPTGKGVSSLTLWTRGWGSGQWERTIRFKEPAMDVKKAINRIKQVMEEYPQPGPVEHVGLRVERLGYPRGRQKSLFSDVRAKDHLREEIRQLEFRLGSPQLYRLKEVEPWSRIPERRYALIPSSR